MPRFLALMTAFVLAPATAHAQAEPVGQVPEAARAISISFVDYGDRDVMFVSTLDGLYAYDLEDPVRPRRLDLLTKEELMLPGDQADANDMGFFENEDMDVDARRKLVFLSRDVLAFSSGVAGVYLVDASDPANLKLGRFVPLPAGHTTTCIAACDFLWTTGAGSRGEVYVTDVRDPANPVVSPEPIRTESGTGFPNSVPIGSHDVNVDAHGIAWVSGHAGVRGYRTSGAGASPAQPVLVAGGRVRPAPGAESFAGMHGSLRRGDLLYVTDERFDECESAGNLLITPVNAQGEELPLIGAWNPAGQPGTAETGECSAHWADFHGDLLVMSFYAQGTRFLDVSDPARPRQVAYWRPEDARAWAPYSHRGLVYVADFNRGVDILRLREDVPGAPPAPFVQPGPVACAPAVAIRRVALTRRRVRIGGTATCAARVEVSVARGPWRRARGTATWTYARRARLRRGRHVVRARAVAADGGMSRPFTRRVRRR